MYQNNDYVSILLNRLLFKAIPYIHYMKKLLNFINGEFTEPIDQQYFDNINPATGQMFAKIPDSNEKDVNLAIRAAKEAFPKWSRTSVESRYKVLLKIADLIEENLDTLAAIESEDNGKPLWLAKKVDIPRASSNFRFFATGILHFASESHQMVGQAINYTIRQPMGVVGCISPWNLPLYLFTWKIAPALAAGNTVVAKPSELTPMSSFKLSEICQEAGLPPGVLNIVHGFGHSAGEAIVRDERIKAISFTGGTKTGARIASIAAPVFKKLSLELGGKNPNIIFADCDYEEMIRTTVRSSFANQGQICLCGSRIFVEKSIYSKFIRDFKRVVENLKVGDPKDPETKIGAVVSKSHMQKILSYINLAKEEGGTIICGGEQVDLPGDNSNGYFIQPTIITDLDYRCRTNQEEIFGPVVTVTPFETEEEVVQMANSTKYGLSASIWTQNIHRSQRLAEQLHAGIIWINTWLLRDLRTPFGGVKDSGMGREGGWEALRFFTEAKNICIAYKEKS
jgi:aminomuconate-semialdehyde/2-hydroxymuconate-6-semialdehyde dehydrogenase